MHRVYVLNNIAVLYMLVTIFYTAVGCSWELWPDVYSDLQIIMESRRTHYRR